MEFLVLTSALAVVFVTWFAYQKFRYHVRMIPPGPLGIPLLGVIPFLGKEPHKYFARLCKKYGQIFSVPMGAFNAVVVSDYETMKELFSHPSSLGRPDKFFDILPGKGGFAGMNGDVWQEQRRFCIQTLRNLGVGRGLWETIIQADVMEFSECIQKFDGKPADVSGPLNRSAMSSNTSLMTGQRFENKETNPDVKTMEAAHHVLTQHTKITNPVASMPWLLKYLVKFNIAGYAEKIAVLEKFSNIFRREVVKREKSSKESTATDFVGHYFAASGEHGASKARENCSEENLIGHMVALFVAGNDTTVASIHWLMVLMAAYPQIQQRIQEEIDEVIGKDASVYWDDRKKLPYTMAVIYEMERWVPITPFYPPRCAMENFQFRRYTIPKGTMIIVNSWSLHRDPKYWDNPHEYKPERFLINAEKTGKDPSKLEGYAPFSSGKRNCPGETVAMMTIFLYFAGMMQKFTVKPPPGCQPKLQAEHNAIVHPQNQELCFIERL